jgi:hypothetical protein
MKQARPRLAGVVLGVIAAAVAACSFRAKTSGGAAGSGVAGASGSGTGGGGAGGGAGVASGAGGVIGGSGSAGSGGVGGNSASTGAFPPPINGVTSVSATGPNATPPIPSDAAKKFTGTADASRNPELVYPNDHVLFPPNVFGVEIHWRPGSAMNTLFELSFKGASLEHVVYTRCQPLADGCLYSPPDDVWGPIAQANLGGTNVQLTVRGTDDDGMAVGTSSTFSLAFAKDALRGGLYYWTTSQGSGIMRRDFGDTTKTAAERFIGTQFTGGTCVGCHALSRDGAKIIASAGGEYDGRLLLFDVAHAQPAVPFPLTQRSQFESWSPTGGQFVGVYTDDRKTGPSNLLLFDGMTGASASAIELGGLRADHPDWSQDGNRIVFTSVDPTGSYADQEPGHAGISYVDFVAGAWSAPKSLVAAVDGKNHYYPAIGPDNTTLVYDESTCASGSGTYGKECNADTDPTATLWTTRLPPSAVTPVALGLANMPGVADAGNASLTNSFPKWAPFVFHLSEQQNLLWLTFSSTRRYGLRQPPPGGHVESDVGNLIWMVGINPGSSSADPSFAAFALPFQDITTSNHIAQWTEKVVPVIP